MFSLRSCRSLFLFALLALVLAAVPAVAQDCTQSTTFTADGDSPAYQVTNRGCSFWLMVFEAHGFATLSVSFQSAADTGAGPGAFADVAAGTPATNGFVYGSNPSTSVTGDGPILVRGFFPYVRVHVSATTGAGQIRATLYGWKAPQPGIAP